MVIICAAPSLVVLSRVLLCQDAVMHDQHPIANRKQPLVMSDHHRGLAQLVGLVGEQMSDVLRPSGVQGGGGLIGQDDVRVVVERHRDGGALTLAPGELGGVGVGALGDAE